MLLTIHPTFRGFIKISSNFLREVVTPIDHPLDEEVFIVQANSAGDAFRADGTNWLQSRPTGETFTAKSVTAGGCRGLNGKFISNKFLK